MLGLAVARLVAAIAHIHIIRLLGNIRAFDIDKSFSSDDNNVSCQNKIPYVEGFAT